MNYNSNKSYKSFGNRGMSLENDINDTNTYYLINDIALIYKKPTPIKTTRVAYNNKSAIIKEGFYEKPSTTDYNGIYKGKYIDFEAKETNSKTSFPISNIHSHQLTHLTKVLQHGGISFIIVRFTPLFKTFLLEVKYLEKFINENKRKSIPIEYFEQYGFLIKEGFSPRLGYLKIIDFIEMGNNSEEYT